MSVDIHIHVKTPLITEKIMEEFFRNEVGSKYFDPNPWDQPLRRKCTLDELKGFKNLSPRDWSAYFELDGRTPRRNYYVPDYSYVVMMEVPNIEIGKSRGGEDAASAVCALIGEDTEIDDVLIQSIAQVMQTSSPDLTSSPEEVVKFLLEHSGQKCFTIGW